MINKICNLAIYIDNEKIDQISQTVSSIVDKYFSNLSGGVILAIFIVLILFSAIRSSR